MNFERERSPATDDNLVKIVVPLKAAGLDDGEWPPFAAENLWAIRCGDLRFRIDNVPFYTLGINYGDIVSASPTTDPNRFDFVAVMERSGNATLRMRVNDSPDSKAAVESLVSLFQGLGCVTETDVHTGVVAIDLPPSVDHATVEGILSECDARGIVEVERG